LGGWGMGFPEDVPVLVDEGVRLRAHTAGDVDAAVEMCRDPEFARWTTVPVPYERTHAEQFLLEKIPAGWRDGGMWSWAIEYDGRFAGSVDLRDGRGGGGEIGYGLAPWARGKGVMTRAVRLAVRHAFDGFGWDVVLWRAFTGNWASRRVAWRAGFREFVTERGAGVARGVRHDEWVASVRAGEDLQPQGRWLTAPLIEAGGLRMRPFRDEDADRIVEGAGDERTQHWLSFLPSPYGPEDARGWIARSREESASGFGVSWAVTDPVSDRMLANVSVFRLARDGSAEVGYWSHPDARGKGVTTTGVRHAVRHAFAAESDGGLGLHRLYLQAAAGNTASQHVARSAGFRQTGTQRDGDARRDGSFEDLLTFDLLATDIANGSGLVESPG
jgi:RimJ/RimL family protein N-acetyltransferase